MAGYNLKDEKEVKQFLENLGIEYRFSCYHEMKPDGCHLLGDYLEAVKKDFKKALTVFQRNCDEYNYGKSCYKYAAYRHMGKGSERDDATSFSYFDKGCRLDNPESCLIAGVMKINGSILPKDYPTASAYFDKSCHGRNTEACHNASSLFITGAEGLVKDMKKAFEYAIKACELGHAHSCANLSQMYGKGEGTERNEELAEKFKKIAIDMQNQHKRESQQLKFAE